jgi:hypothetical protein
MGLITVAAVASAAVANSFAKMGTAMKGSKDDWIAVQNAITAISAANFKGGGMLADLANLLKKPLKVEFSDKEVAVVSNVTMNIDGYKFHQATKTGSYVTQSTVDTQAGKNGPG